MPITYHKKKEEKMLSRKKRIKQMNFQIQERRLEEMKPLSEDDKFLKETLPLRHIFDHFKHTVTVAETGVA